MRRIKKCVQIILSLNIKKLENHGGLGKTPVSTPRGTLASKLIYCLYKLKWSYPTVFLSCYRLS